MKKVYIYILALVAVFLICVFTYADEVSDLKKKQNSIQSDINAASGLLKEVISEKNTTLAEIDALDDELNIVTDELSYLGEQLKITQAALVQTEEDLANATEKREAQYSAYKKRVRYQYINGTTGYLEVILSAKDVTDLLNRVEYVNRIVESDRNMTARLVETENLITEKLYDINKTKREVELLTVEYENKYEELDGAIQRKAAFVRRLNANEESYQKQIEDLRADDKRVTTLIKEAEARQEAEKKARLAASAVYYSGGKLMWPVPSSGYISSGYVNRLSPISGRAEFHTGIDIPAAYGANVVAAEGGTVLSAGWNGGYGNAVVISHGGGLSTLYGHNSKLLVSAGQTVAKGQVIAQIGSTGYSTGNHSHFEVRVNGAHTNPMPYLK